MGKEDDGPGLPAELTGRMFERFVKGGASDGHGLGRAFVRAIVCAHGGTVRAGNRPGGGAYVEITLPASREGGESVGCLAARQAGPSGSK
jgi:signal transduction histidine kinase